MDGFGTISDILDFEQLKLLKCLHFLKEPFSEKNRQNSVILIHDSHGLFQFSTISWNNIRLEKFQIFIEFLSNKKPQGNLF